MYVRFLFTALSCLGKSLENQAEGSASTKTTENSAAEDDDEKYRYFLPNFRCQTTMSALKKRKELSPLDQALTGLFQQLNMTPDYDHNHQHNFSRITSIIDQICSPKFFGSHKFPSVFKICLNRLLNITSHDKCQNFTRMEILRLLNEIANRGLYTNNFHILMFELYKVLKDTSDKLQKLVVKDPRVL